MTAGTSRRSFFKQSGTAAVALASTAAMPISARERESQRALFQHGVASGDPLSDRVILWTRITPQSPRRTVSVRYEVATDPRMRRVVKGGEVRTNVSRDFTVKVDVAGLRAGATYYYRFEVEDESSPIGRTRSLPAGGTPRLRMAVVSCSNHAAGYFNAYRQIAARADLDMVIHLGDYLYEYGPNQFGSLRMPEPPREMVTLDD